MTRFGDLWDWNSLWCVSIHLSIWYFNLAQVALERVKEFTDLEREPPEFVEPRPDPSWPNRGAISCQNLVIRYAVRKQLCHIHIPHLINSPSRISRTSYISSILKLIPEKRLVSSAARVGFVLFLARKKSHLYLLLSGSGKSTLALSFFRFVEPTEGSCLLSNMYKSGSVLTLRRENFCRWH